MGKAHSAGAYSYNSGRGRARGSSWRRAAARHRPRHPPARLLRRAHQPRRPPTTAPAPPQPPQRRRHRRLSARRQTARTPPRCRTTSRRTCSPNPTMTRTILASRWLGTTIRRVRLQSWNKPAPGSGSTVTAFAVDYYPPPTPLPDNVTWQAVNKALNANVQMTQMTGTRLSAADGDHDGRQRRP